MKHALMGDEVCAESVTVSTPEEAAAAIEQLRVVRRETVVLRADGRITLRESDPGLYMVGGAS